MTTETNKAIIRRYYDDVHNHGNVPLLTELTHADYVEHNPFPGHGQGLAGLQQRVELLQRAFRGAFTIEDMIAEGEKVVVRWTGRVVQHGEFLGIPPTGKSATYSGIDIFTLRDGRMAEHWDVVDVFGLLQQLGVLPQS